MTTVLVTGVRGNTGRHVAAFLAERTDVELRGGSSNPASIELEGVVPVRFDWLDPATWGEAADGVDAVYIVRPEREDAPELVGRFLDGSPEVGRVVLLSDNIHGEDVPGSSWEGRVEHAVTSRAKDWTLLRPTWFAQSLAEPRYLLSSIRDDGKIEIPTAGAAIAWVDARDIAAVAVEALLNPGHDGQGYSLTGPEAVTVADLATRISTAIGHTVEHIDAPLAEAVDNFANVDGVDPWYVDYIHRVWALVSNGSAGVISDDIERVTGRPARTLNAFIEEHADVWRRES